MATVLRVKGKIRYDGERVILNSEEGPHLLIIDKAPFGHFGLEDVFEAYKFFQALGFVDGDSACVQGIRDKFGPSTILQLVRLCQV